MKRALAALVMLGIVTAGAAPSMAATTVYGSAQLKYTVNATAAVSIAVNYDSNGAIQPAVASTILGSGAGLCSAGVAEASNATLTFGGITPPSGAGYTTCFYKNALSVGVNSNDSAGVNIFEYVDVLQPGTTICAYKLDGNLPKSKPTQSAATAITGQNTCAAPTGGAAGAALSALGATTAGSGYGAQGNPGAPATVVVGPGTPTSTVYPGAGGLNMYTTASAPPAGWNFLGEDVSVSISNAAPSGAQTSVITVAMIPS
ncbi:MAG: hypothetical protein JOZ24_12425 [Candidatus Eremiobacteraeota bacterium]|nr:hypothetical protein [Candidatus Eremiobacteraeota bacterium]